MKKQNVIIVDGPDKSGKSTIGKMLAERLGVPYFKYVRDKEALAGSDMTSRMLKYADPYFVDFLRQTKTSVVIYRHYIAEWCYSKVLGRSTDEEGVKKTDELFSQLPAVVLILKRKSYVGVSDDDPRLNSEALQHLSERYDEFASWSKCRVVTFEFDEWNPERMVEEVLRRLRMENTE